MSSWTSFIKSAAADDLSKQWNAIMDKVRTNRLSYTDLTPEERAIVREQQFRRSAPINSGSPIVDAATAQTLRNKENFRNAHDKWVNDSYVKNKYNMSYPTHRPWGGYYVSHYTDPYTLQLLGKPIPQGPNSFRSRVITDDPTDVSRQGPPAYELDPSHGVSDDAGFNYSRDILDKSSDWEYFNLMDGYLPNREYAQQAYTRQLDFDEINRERESQGYMRPIQEKTPMKRDWQPTLSAGMPGVVDDSAWLNAIGETDGFPIRVVDTPIYGNVGAVREMGSGNRLVDIILHAKLDDINGLTGVKGMGNAATSAGHELNHVNNFPTDKFINHVAQQQAKDPFNNFPENTYVNSPYEALQSLAAFRRTFDPDRTRYSDPKTAYKLMAQDLTKFYDKHKRGGNTWKQWEEENPEMNRLWNYLDKTRKVYDYKDSSLPAFLQFGGRKPAPYVDGAHPAILQILKNTYAPVIPHLVRNNVAQGNTALS